MTIESAPQGERVVGTSGGNVRVIDHAAPLAAPLVAPGWKLVPLAPTADMVRAGNARYKCGLLVVQRTYADMLAATPPAPLQGQSAALPALWQWRRKDQPWSLEKTFEHEVFATTADSEVRQLYASLPLPAPAGVEGGEKQDCGHPSDETLMLIWDDVPPQGDPSGHKFAIAFARAVLSHPAVNDSPMASPAPLQEPCALDRPELPVRLSEDARDAARYRWLRDDGYIEESRIGAHWLQVLRMDGSLDKVISGVSDLDETIDAALSAQGNGGTA